MFSQDTSHDAIAYLAAGKKSRAPPLSVYQSPEKEKPSIGALHIDKIGQLVLQGPAE